jgi:hypothetical protein
VPSQRTLSAACAAAFLLVPAGPAAAEPGASCQADKRNASIDQYCESVPTVSGARGIADKEPSAGRTAKIPARVARQLAATADGRMLLAATQPDTPAPEPAAKPRKRSRAAAPADTGESPVVRAMAPAAASEKLSAGDAFDGLPVALRILLVLAVAGLAFAALLGMARRPGSRR